MLSRLANSAKRLGSLQSLVKAPIRILPTRPNLILTMPKRILLSGMALSLPSDLTPQALWNFVCTIPTTDPMAPVLFLIFFQAIMGVFDNIYHHELTERLPWRVGAHREQLIHMARGGLYSLVFLSLAGVTPHGAFATGLAGILAVEAGLTLYDFVIEDATRKLPWTERITHTLLTLNYGAVLALWLPIILGNWAHQPTGFHLINYGLPTYAFGFTVAGVLYWMFRDFFAARRLAKFVENDKQHPFKMNLNKKMKFLITGGTGFIGTQLIQSLLREGHEVTVITRNKISACENLGKVQGKITFVESFDLMSHPEEEHFDTVINLAGEPLVGKRWTAKQKSRIFDSRVGTTNQLMQFIEKMHRKPSLLINGSAIGYYGATINDNDVTEDSSPTETATLSQNLCSEWEKSALKAQEFGTRVVCLRTGIVLGREGGVMSQMLFPFEFGLGGNMGSGKQWMPWIHVHDLLSIMAFAINNEHVEGPINGTAPHPVKNSEFTKTLGSVLHRPAFMHLPGFLLKILFGSHLAQELLLTGQRVIPQKMNQESSFEFLYPNLENALQEIVNGKIQQQKRE